jgi:hypothetical protein
VGGCGCLRNRGGSRFQRLAAPPDQDDSESGCGQPFGAGGANTAASTRDDGEAGGHLHDARDGR